MVLLVTGRILDELRRVAGDLHFVDGVVAENGAVIHFPASGHTTALAPLVPARFLDELRRRGIPHRAGQCLVDADANEAPRAARASSARLELPLVLIFNRGRVMTVPQGGQQGDGAAARCSTRCGCRRATPSRSATPRTTTSCCGWRKWASAVEWGSARCGPRPTSCSLVPARRRSRTTFSTRRHRQPAGAGTQRDAGCCLGHTGGRTRVLAGGARAQCAGHRRRQVGQIVGGGTAVRAADPARLLRLRHRPGGRLPLARGACPVSPCSAATTRRRRRASCCGRFAIRIGASSSICRTGRTTRRSSTSAPCCRRLNVIRRRTGLPHRILLDEAHYFLHDDDAHRPARLRANGYTVVTYCASRLPQALLAATEVMIVTLRIEPGRDRGASRPLCRHARAVDAARWAMLGRLEPAQAVALPLTEEAGGELRLFTIGARLTPHVRHREKYVDVPVSEDRAFVFEPNGQHGSRVVRTLRQFVAELERRPDWTATLGAATFAMDCRCLRRPRPRRRTAGDRSRASRCSLHRNRAGGRRGHPGWVRARILRDVRLSANAA